MEGEPSYAAPWARASCCLCGRKIAPRDNGTITERRIVTTRERFTAGRSWRPTRLVRVRLYRAGRTAGV
jgi:hypothetical protein